MNGPADYTEQFTTAKECVMLAIEERSAILMDAAMVHAQLASAAALAAAFAITEQAMPETPIYDAAAKALAKPLVTCPDGLEDGTVRCQLPVGHDGMHEDDSHEPVLWWTAEDLSVTRREDQAAEPELPAPALVRPYAEQF